MSAVTETQGDDAAATFYHRAVKDAAQLIAAERIRGVDRELAMLRTRLDEHARAHPEDLDLVIKGVRLVAQIVAAQYRMSPARTDELADTMASALRQVGAQLFPERFAERAME